MQLEWEECRASGCWRWNSSTTAGAWTSMWGSHMLSECDHLTNLTRYHSLPHLNLESRISLTLYSSWLWRLWAFHNLIRDVGADDGDRYDRVDVLLPCREAELDSGWGDDLCDGEGASPFVVKLLHGVIRGVILEA